MRLLGVFGKDVTVTNAASFGSMLGSTIGEPFIVGSDARFGSLPMKFALSSGLLSSGCNVADLGFVPSPVLARAAREERVWGIHFSSDPYPPEYVGVKVYDPSGKPWDGRLDPHEGDRVGRLASIDLVPNYMGELMDMYDPEPVRVVVDSANGPTGQVVPALLRSMGLQVMEVNSSLSPVTSRGYEPSADSLRDLEFIVRRKRADLGVAFDGAGSKAGFVVPGAYISAGRAMALLMKFNGFDRVVADYGATDLLDLVGVVERVPASEVRLAERLHAKGFEVGGGTMGVMFSEWSFAPDGIMLLLELLQAASKRGETIEALNEQLPENYEMAGMVRCRDPEGAVEDARKSLSEHELDLREGVKVVFEDGWVWLKPMKGFVRVSAEAGTKKRARELMELGKSSIKRYI